MNEITKVVVKYEDGTVEELFGKLMITREKEAAEDYIDYEHYFKDMYKIDFDIMLDALREYQKKLDIQEIMRAQNYE